MLIDHCKQQLEVELEKVTIARHEAVLKVELDLLKMDELKEAMKTILLQLNELRKEMNLNDAKFKELNARLSSSESQFNEVKSEQSSVKLFAAEIKQIKEDFALNSANQKELSQKWDEYVLQDEVLQKEVLKLQKELVIYGLEKDTCFIKERWLGNILNEL